MKFRLTNKPNKVLQPKNSDLYYGVSRRGIMTRYGRKMLEEGAKYYGRVTLKTAYGIQFQLTDQPTMRDGHVRLTTIKPSSCTGPR